DRVGALVFVMPLIPDRIAKHRPSLILINFRVARSGIGFAVGGSDSAPIPASPQGASSVVATAKADTKNSKQYKPKVFARRPNNYGYGYGYGLGYAEERGGPKGLFFR